MPPQRPSSGRTVQVRRSRPASAIRPATAATLRPSNLKAGAVAGLETVSFSSHTQSGAATRSPRYPTATTRPAAPSQPTTVRRDATGLLVRAVLTRYATAVLASACVSSRLRRRAARSSPRAVRARHGSFCPALLCSTWLQVPHSVLGSTEEFEAALARLHPPPDPAPSSAEPTPRSGTGQDSQSSSPQRPSARSASFGRSSAGRPPTTLELEAARREHRLSETPAQVRVGVRVRVRIRVRVREHRLSETSAQAAG